MPQGQISKPKNRNNVVTNSVKTLKIVHIKISLKIKKVKLLIKADKNPKIIGKKKKKSRRERKENGRGDEKKVWL